MSSMNDSNIRVWVQLRELLVEAVELEWCLVEVCPRTNPRALELVNCAASRSWRILTVSQC